MNKVLLIGDSITEGFDTGSLLQGYNIINKGIYGDNSEGVLKRLARDVINHQPDEVYLLIGTNDFALGRSNEELLGSLNLIAGYLVENLPGKKIYITSILPTRKVDNRPNERINEVNRLILKLCTEYGIDYFNLHDELVDESGELRHDYTEDGLHLNDKAYAKWAEVLKPRLV